MDLPPIATLDELESSPAVPRAELPEENLPSDAETERVADSEPDDDEDDEPAPDPESVRETTPESAPAATAASAKPLLPKPKPKPKPKLKPVVHTPGHALLPLGRVQRIMKAHSQFLMRSLLYGILTRTAADTLPMHKEAVQLIAVATVRVKFLSCSSVHLAGLLQEEFIKHLASSSQNKAQSHRRQMITYKDAGIVQNVRSHTALTPNLSAAAVTQQGELNFLDGKSLPRAPAQPHSYLSRPQILSQHQSLSRLHSSGGRPKRATSPMARVLTLLPNDRPSKSKANLQ